ncbi:MAG: energy-coupling factor transporter ATPase [Chloroflexota bacterium]|nr:energy-coupling factor transporter ATPase [Chloroflexota bacterium]
MISIKGLTFRYRDATKPALHDIDLEIADGEFVLITGPSGCGKSSLCRSLNGLIPHFYGGEIEGSISVQGLDVMNHMTKELATKVGMVFQDPENQLVAQDVEREIAFGLENLSFPRDVIAKRIEESLDTLGISSLRYKPVYALSGGEKQKVAIASVLALHPDVLILDEPTSELDPKSAEEVLSIVQRLNDELGITVILVEHRLERVIHLVDRIVVLNEGTVIADDRPRVMMANGYMSSVGVGLPPIIRMVRKLRGDSVNASDIPLTVKEGRAMLEEMFKNTKKSVPSHIEKTMGQPTIKIENLWYVYPDGPTALKNISLSICEGEFVAIMGRNASGKTTLVKHINGLLKPTKGTIDTVGTDTRRATVAELAHNVGFVFQNPNDHLFADTVEQELAATLKNMGFNHGELSSRVEEMLELFNLKEYRKQYPRSLSGGEKQRVATASVLVARPKVLILDEPTRGMEYRHKSELMRFLKGYRERGNTVILVTHDVETVAEYADRVILLSEGKIVVDGNTRDVLSRALFFSPQINRLMQAFEKYGAPNNILTVEEALDIVK